MPRHEDGGVQVMGAPTAGRSTDDPVAARTVPGGRRSCPPASGPAGCGIPGNGGAAAGISVLLALIRRSLNGVSEFRENSLAARISYPLPCCAALISAPRLPAEIWQTGCSGGWLHPDHARLADFRTSGTALALRAARQPQVSQAFSARALNLRIRVRIPATFAGPFGRGRLQSVIGSKRTVMVCCFLALALPRGCAGCGAGTRSHDRRYRITTRAAVCPRCPAERQTRRSGPGGADRAVARPRRQCLAQAARRWRSVMVTRLDTRRQCRCGSA